MARGILYVMTTVVPGLIKIGKTGADKFNNRMNYLERNGYANVTGLQRRFAIEVNDYDEKETLLHTIFSKSNVAGTELFASDVDLVVQLLSSLDGKVVYPVSENKGCIFSEATENIVEKEKGIDKQKKASRFKFSMVNIKEGELLEYVNDPKITVQVADDTHVIYNNEKWSLSPLAKKLAGVEFQVQGTLYFSYNGKKLTDLRKEIEEQNKQ